MDALEGRKACLLAHHGMIAIGASLQEALAVAVEVENLCEQYWRLLQLTPSPSLLSEDEMQAVLQQFKGYGKWHT
jgi:L-fuculose-phosphate aldolase